MRATRPTKEKLEKNNIINTTNTRNTNGCKPKSIKDKQHRSTFYI